ncbi:MAG: alanine--tRNA ligase [Candidatus Cloacimonetes bacterium 4572_55]|nr:MAG: alanine--tRNA ligase [Candidatus Cloacimonetes bacterium 4572_55]
MKSDKVRSTFIDFFRQKGHIFVPSSSLIPEDDPTLLFANAGMNQFKRIFLGKETRDYNRAANSQKCIRAGGKHNDLEDVGEDDTHLTFFEMLGNWSFGDYYKAEAIEWAWELLTEVYGLEKKQLWATVHHTDDEAMELWHKITGISRDRILKFGDKDNFWEMSEVGPCGPCSEIHYYFGKDVDNQDPNLINVDHPDYIEIWNLVFIQYNRQWSDPLDVSRGAHIEELSAKHVDTGMGFERLTSVLQGKNSVYETDIFKPIIEAIEQILKKPYSHEKGFAHRVIADHIRALTFAFTDGAVPSNEDKGYVLRKILRRAARQGWIQGLREPFLYELVSVVVEKMGGIFPELKERRTHVSKLILTEEERFLSTVSRGIEMFHQLVEDVKRRGGTVISGDQAFRLHDTYGFPLDLTIDLAESEQLVVELPGFEQSMKAQQERSRAVSGFTLDSAQETEWQGDPEAESSEFVGYDQLTIKSKIVAWRTDPVDPHFIHIILDRTPYYGESGGQVGDRGDMWETDIEIRISDAQRWNDKVIHIGWTLRGELSVGQELNVRVDEKLRRASMRNHTATHLLHGALHQVLGNHAQQAGSLVSPDYLRFDFTHYEQVKSHQLEEIKAIVNEHTLRNEPVRWKYCSLDEARRDGAMALFGEKYGDTVRVVRIGDFSMELCAGTHLSSTGGIGLFVITSEGGIAAGVRRIEALTGEAAYQYFHRQSNLLKQLCLNLKSNTGDLEKRVVKLIEENKELHREIIQLREKSAHADINEFIQNATEFQGFKIVAKQVDARDMEDLRRMGDALRDSLKSGVGMLGAAFQNKGALVCVVTDDLIKEKGLKAGLIVKKAAKLVGGGGGGRPHFAQAGAKDVEKIGYALEKTVDIVQSLI